ncbi:ABC transporter substrate-binding protein [Cognatiyoonia sp. IB215182]|uniref:ABC transporter substrate-binding protein n=1 Tax=Cognatiyoonia sp. IB215182 TaxID=3097353 RepID=UPI002A0CBDE2|nr:ABC transporter substrate-binding protein [Cognatiyoonia sp. IB215182]MDX8354781.1 ABC transporter substrate-binding protein [Cognatiyoonia sp. IB215182]
MRHALTTIGVLLLNPVSAFADCASAERLLDHHMLDAPVCIPADPKRIAFTMEEIIAAYAMGGESVVDNWYFQSFRGNFPGMTKTVDVPPVDVSYYPQSDIETLTLAAPDLIVSFTEIDNNAKAAELAPVVALTWEDETTWRDLHHFIALLLDKEDEGQTMLDALDGRIARLNADLGDMPRSFAIVRTMDDGDTLQTFTALNFGALILQDAGLQIGPDILSPEASAELRNAWWYPMSTEKLQTLDVDHLFVLTGWEPEIEAAFLESALWQALPAVAEGRVIRPQGDGEQFIRENIVYAHRVVDFAYEHVLGTTAEVAGNPNPFADWLAE